MLKITYVRQVHDFRSNLYCFDKILTFYRFSAQEDEDDAHPNLLRRTTIGNGLKILIPYLHSNCFLQSFS